MRSSVTCTKGSFLKGTGEKSKPEDCCRHPWIPDCAGMTGVRMRQRMFVGQGLCPCRVRGSAYDAPRRPDCLIIVLYGRSSGEPFSSSPAASAR
jgi:hypothetical protein